MIKEEQNPVGPVLTAAESRRRVLHNMCSSLLYNLTVILIVVFYGIPGIVSYLVQGKYRSFMEVEGKSYVITYITTAIMAAGNLLRMLALLFTRSILLVQVTYCVPSVFQVVVLTAYIRKKYPWLNAHDTPNLEALSQRGSVLVHQLTNIVFSNTDTILISSLCGLTSASVYTIYMLFFSNIEKLFYSVVNSISFRLGQLFYVEPERFKRLYRLYDALYLAVAFALFTTVAVFLMPIIALYTAGVTDAEYLDTRLLVLFTAVEVLSSAKQPAAMLLTISGRFEETREQALIEMGINLLVCLKGALAGLWMLPLYLVVNAALDRRNVDTLRQVLQFFAAKKGTAEGKSHGE